MAESTKKNKNEKMRKRVDRRMKRLGCLSSRGLGQADQRPGIYIPCSFQAGPFPVPAVMSGGFHQPHAPLAPRGSALAWI